jgi:dTDP-4-dehydrorhamnose 3,5-epimerase
MRFTPVAVDGAYLVELERHEDERGFFARAWCRDELLDHGLVAELSQSSISRNDRTGTLRGMHFQTPPHEEAKLVRCVAGAIFDVVADLRPDSPTYLRSEGVRLDAESGAALYIPKGCAHGFQTLVDRADVLYMISDPYVPESASGVRFDDPALDIEWPETDVRTISDRDLAWPSYRPNDAGG